MDLTTKLHIESLIKEIDGLKTVISIHISKVAKLEEEVKLIKKSKQGGF